MCYVDGCGKADELGSHFVTGACKHHFQERQQILASQFPGLQANAQLCHDVALAYILMSDEAAVLARLDGLNDFLGQVDPNGHGLSAALEYFELVCWFPRVRIIPAGVLSSAQFLYLIAHGCVLKDVGAGAPHGRLTHRLQWHALMSVMTNEFNDPFDSSLWHHSPLELYCALGESSLTKGNTSVWGQVFDLGGSNPASRFRAPDRLHTAVLKSSKLSIQMNLASKLQADAANLVPVVRKDLSEAVAGQGAFATFVPISAAGRLLLEYQSLFGPGKVYTFDDLYQFLDLKIYKGSQTQNYPNAYLYIVKTATPEAVKLYLKKKKRPTNLDILAKPGFYPPDDTTIQDRITKSRSNLNWVDAQQIKLAKGWA